MALDSVQAAERATQRIETAVERLADFPLSGRAGSVAGTREVVVTGLPYIIVYRVMDSEVQILRVYHSSRDVRHVFD
jgi:addiction module RelE/StbE family toxin